MSLDVQMFVLCDHYLNVPLLENPIERPKLLIVDNDKSMLAQGTYYVANSFVSKHGGETKISPISKIYIKQNQSIDINVNSYLNIHEDENIKKNIYVSYVPENLTNSTLTNVQLEKENNAIKFLFYQDTIESERLNLESFIPNSNVHPSKNSSNFGDYTSRESLCPKCLGKGYYYDIFFDNKGKAITATKSQKLLQECLKVLIDDKLGNLYHPEWGCDVNERIGTKNKGTVDLFRIELAVRDSIERLKNLQQNNQLLYFNMYDEELIDSIESIEVEKDGPTGYNVNIKIVSKIGDLITYSVKM